MECCIEQTGRQNSTRHNLKQRKQVIHFTNTIENNIRLV